MASSTRVIGGWQVSAINTMQAGTPFNITYGPNGAQAVSPQISATYRGANEYRPNYVPGQKVTQGRSNRAANTGYVNYINFNAFVLPPIKDAAGNVLSPFGNASRNPGRTPAFYQTDLALNKKFTHPHREPEGRIPHRVLQPLQPHQPVPSRQHQRNSGHDRQQPSAPAEPLHPAASSAVFPTAAARSPAPSSRASFSSA